MRRFWALLLACAVWLSACGGNDASGQPDASGEFSGAAEDNGGEADALTNAQISEISDLVQACARAIPDDFSSPSDIPAYLLTQFLYTRMEADGLAGSFEQADDGMSIQVPIETIRQYAVRYFALDKVTMDFFSQRYFDGQSVTIPNSQRAERELPYSFSVSSVESTDGGTVRAVLKLSSGGMDYQRWVFRLRPSENGFVMVSMEKRPVEFGLYAVNHVTATVNTLMDIPVNSMTAGEFEFHPFGNLMLVSASNGRALRIGLFDMNTYTSSRYVEFPQNTPPYSGYDIQVVGDKAVVYLTDQAIVLDQELSEQEKTAIPYPDGLLRHCDSYTKRFALSPDQRYIAFSNIDGLNFYNLNSGDLHLMQPHTTGVDGVMQMTWEPVVFNAKNNSLLARLVGEDGISVDMFGILNTQNASRAMAATIQLRGDADTLFSVVGDRLMAFSPTSVRFRQVNTQAPLDQAFVEYNVATGTPLIVPTDFVLYEPDGGIATADRKMLLAGDDVYKTESIKIGEDMVSSFSVRAFDVAMQRGQSLDFGYVDRNASLELLASVSGKVVAACRGMFIQSIVVI